VNHLISLSPLRLAFGFSLLLLISGCGRDDVKSYQVAKPKPTAAQPTPASLPPGHPEVGPAMPGGLPDPGVAMRPRVTWKTPEGWSETAPGTMRVGSFKIKGKDDKQADVSIIPLAGAAGGEVANVNRWRGQVGLEPASADEIRKLAQHVEVAAQPADLYELSGKNPGSGDPLGVLAAIARREGTAWFFKMTGDPGVIADQKPAFVEFLKAIKFEAGEVTGMPPGHPPMEGRSMPTGHPEVATIPILPGTAAAIPPAEGKPTWQVPAGWAEVPGGQFLVAKFNLSGGGDAQAAVNVSVSAGDGGGLANNVNRWRKQLGLAELSGDEINQSVVTLDVAGGKATLVEMSGTDARTGQPAKVIGAMVPQAGQTWYYKLMGDAPAVEAQKEAFARFVQTVKY
jgi:hypothetical protein